MAKKITVIMLLVFIAIMFVWRKKNSENILTVNIGYFPNITHAQALVMKEQCLLENKFGSDISVNWLSFNAGPTEIEAFISGAVDIGYIGPVPAINGYIRSLGDLRIIAGASNGGSILVVKKNSNIASVDDLVNKTVAVPQFGNTQHLILLNLLRSNGLADVTNGGNVKIVASSNADIANLMNRGNIDAALVPEPWGSILEHNQDSVVLLDYDEVDIKNIPSTAVVIVRKDFLENHRNIVEAFIETHIETTLFIDKNADKAKEIVNNQIYEVTQQFIDTEVLDCAFERLDITYSIPENSIMEFALVSCDEGIVSDIPNVDIIDNSLVD